ncbi:U6 snRNA-associated Sm-like protein, partial [Gorgonomyces haynaldii]
MLPLSLLNTAVGHPIVVELKNATTYNGHLVSCDSWMNIVLSQVIMTVVSDKPRFYKIDEIYIKGNHIKHLRIPDHVVDLVRKDQGRTREQRKPQQQRRGGKSQRGRGQRK